MRTDTRDALVPQQTARQEVFGAVCDMTIWRWVRDGVLPAPIKIRGRNYWRRSELDAWIEEQAAARKLSA